jgi:hypothetical protein
MGVLVTPAVPLIRGAVPSGYVDVAKLVGLDPNDSLFTAKGGDPFANPRPLSPHSHIANR